jgi:hypothetical protein
MEDSRLGASEALTGPSTPDEAKKLAVRAAQFKKERGRIPALDSQDAWERRMAEGAAAFMRFKTGGVMGNSDLDALAAELADFAPPEKKGVRPASEERVIAGFEEIQRFTEQHGEDRDIFERFYAVRLDRLRALLDCCALLQPLDHQRLLAGAPNVTGPAEEAVNIDELAAELAGVADADDITVLRHVRNSAEKRAADEIADRKPCEDFDIFRPLLERVQTEVKTALRQSQPIEAGRRAIEVGDFFVLDGITLYVAEVGEPLKTAGREVDRRLRLIFSNGTESNLLLRSLQRAFYDDPAARWLASPESRQLSFGGELEADDVESGTIYVLRSLSDHPYVAQHRDIIHKGA